MERISMHHDPKDNFDYPTLTRLGNFLEINFLFLNSNDFYQKII